MEFKFFLTLAKVDPISESFITDALSARRASLTSINDSCAFAAILSHVLYVEDPFDTLLLQFLSFIPYDWLNNPDVGQVSVICCADWRPLSMSLAYSLLTNELHLDFLTWTQLGNQNVIMKRLRLWNSFSLEAFCLIPDWNPLQITRVDISMVEVRLFVRNTIYLRSRSSRVFLRASHMKSET